ncbi:MAG: hypothetical protein Q4G69_08090 [Planctomycetia bacterium]|nr:hypothetical protein [Planctomycetia bacterium]
MNDPFVLLIHSRTNSASWSEREQNILNHLAVRFPRLRFAGLPFLYDLDPESNAVQWIRDRKGPLLIFSFISDRAVFALLDFFEISCKRSAFSGEIPVSVSSDSVFCSELSVLSEEDMIPVLEKFSKCVERTFGSEFSGKNSDPLFFELSGDQEERWYPLLDRDRCAGCLECLNFCLFGVYSVREDDRPFVLHPNECRNGCPACSRVCPEEAIIFPLYDDPMISGRSAQEKLAGNKEGKSVRDLFPDSLGEEEKDLLESRLFKSKEQKNDLDSEMERLIEDTEKLIRD